MKAGKMLAMSWTHLQRSPQRTRGHNISKIVITMTSDSTTTLSQQRFVSLTTFKRNGQGVPAPMWIGCDGAGLFIWTPADSWKVKRVRNDPRVLLAPSSRSGKVRDDVVPVDATAEVITDPATVKRLQGEIRRKYGLQYYLVTLIEKIAAGGRNKPRVILRIAVASPG
jgi:PPOX class probable F420-dependent enzyme